MKNVSAIQLFTKKSRQAIAAALLAVTMMTAAGSPALAAPTTVRTDGLVLYMGHNYMLNGSNRVAISAVPETSGGRVYVPARDLADAIGADISYNKETGDLFIENDDTSLVLSTKGSVYLVNDELQFGDAAPYINTDNRVMVPLRVISDAFGYELTVTRNDDTKAIDAIYVDKI